MRDCWVYSQLRSPKRERIETITRALAHRGPDQQGVWESASVSLGAVRLKIIDLEHGDQPMISDDGNTVLVFNGEIYNHAELRSELRERGSSVPFALRYRNCAAMLPSNGISMRSRGCGECSRAAFWTQSQQRLVLVRDRVGIKPLYYAQQPGRDLLRLRAEGDSAASGNRSRA